MNADAAREQLGMGADPKNLEDLGYSFDVPAQRQEDDFEAQAEAALARYKETLADAELTSIDHEEILKRAEADVEIGLLTVENLQELKEQARLIEATKIYERFHRLISATDNTFEINRLMGILTEDHKVGLITDEHFKSLAVYAETHKKYLSHMQSDTDREPDWRERQFKD
jgi:predicted 3-demethylubiquinone-9 3-methyltransferase (glyoxalase superfamily)